MGLVEAYSMCGARIVCLIFEVHGRRGQWPVRVPMDQIKVVLPKVPEVVATNIEVVINYEQKYTVLSQKMYNDLGSFKLPLCTLGKHLGYGQSLPARAGLWSIGSGAASPHDLTNAGTQSTLCATNKRQCLIQNQSQGSGIEEYVNKPASFFRISPQIRGQTIAPEWPSLAYRIGISFVRSRAANRAIQESLSPAISQKKYTIM